MRQQAKQPFLEKARLLDIAEKAISLLDEDEDIFFEEWELRKRKEALKWKFKEFFKEYEHI